MTGKVMVVSSDPGLTGLLNGNLPAKGYQVINTHFNENITSSVNEVKPNVLIMDMANPIRQEVPACCQIRDDVEVPVVMVSTRIISKDQIRMIDCSDECMIDEPVANTEFIQRIEYIASDSRTCRY